MDKMDHKKRIMLFGMGDVCYSLIDILNAKIIEEFAARGVECDIVQIVGRKGYTAEIYNRLSSGEYAAALSFNSAGENQLKLTNGENMFDHFNVPFYLFLLDHPMDHVVKLKGAGKGLHVICIDRDHPAYIKRGFPEIEHTHFTLLGGLSAPAGRCDPDSGTVRRIAEDPCRRISGNCGVQPVRHCPRHVRHG